MAPVGSATAPEAKACVEIDRQLEDAGWLLQHRDEMNLSAGDAIGFTITAAAFAGGSISGGAFNPAVGIGPTILHAVMGSGTWQHLWLYLVGPCVGGAIAAGVYGLQEA